MLRQKLVKLLRQITVLVLFFSGLFLQFYVCTLIWILTQIQTSNSLNADVIIVPGARSYINNRYNPCMVGRVDQATRLYQDKYASKIIFSGGDDTEDGVNEARTMAQVAQDQGIPQTDIILEPNSYSTYDNLNLSQQIMIDRGFKSALIVAEPFHMARIKLVARKLGLNYSLYPANTPCWTRWGILSKAFLREPFALAKYAYDSKI